MMSKPVPKADVQKYFLNSSSKMFLKKTLWETAFSIKIHVEKKLSSILLKIESVSFPENLSPFSEKLFYRALLDF